MKRRFFLVIWLCACPASAFGQAVTPADLEGAVVHASVTLDQQIQREGRQFGVQLTQQIRIVFRPDSMIDWSITPTARSARGTRQGPTRKGMIALGKPRDSKFLGGGQAVWIFEDGTLTSLRTYAKAGGYKRTIAFAREGNSFTCTVKDTFVREEGVGYIALHSSIDNAPVRVIGAKQTSSSCKVSKGPAN
jgi:hypothetical protein